MLIVPRGFSGSKTKQILSFYFTPVTALRVFPKAMFIIYIYEYIFGLLLSAITILCWCLSPSLLSSLLYSPCVIIGGWMPKREDRRGDRGHRHKQDTEAVSEWLWVGDYQTKNGKTDKRKKHTLHPACSLNRKRNHYHFQFWPINEKWVTLNRPLKFCSIPKPFFVSSRSKSYYCFSSE